MTRLPIYRFGEVLLKRDIFGLRSGGFRMNGRFVLCLSAALLFALVLSPGYAQEFTIEYAEGDLQVERRGRWLPAYVGDEISAGTNLRLEAGAYAELSDGRTLIRLAEPGSYRIADLARGRNLTSERTLASMIQERIATLTGPGERGPSTAAGVRGDQERGPEDPEWVGAGGSADLVALGKEALAAADLHQARALFADAVLFASPGDEEAQSAFYLGYTLYLLGDTRQAHGYLRQRGPDPDSDFYHEHILILAQTKLELSMPGEAVTLLSHYASRAENDPAILPMVHLLMGLGYRMEGNSARAREQLEQVISLSPESEAADAASEILSELL